MTSAGQRSSGLAEALAREPALTELARTPLMLDIMVRTFRDRSLDSRAATTIERSRRYVFDAYIERMFTRGSARVARHSKQRIVRLPRVDRRGDARPQTVDLSDRGTATLGATGALATRDSRAGVPVRRWIGFLTAPRILNLDWCLGRIWRKGRLADVLRGQMLPWFAGGPLFALILGLLDFGCLEWRRTTTPRKTTSIPGHSHTGGGVLRGVTDGHSADRHSRSRRHRSNDVHTRRAAVSVIWGNRWRRQTLFRDIGARRVAHLVPGAVQDWVAASRARRRALLWAPSCSQVCPRSPISETVLVPRDPDHHNIHLRNGRDARRRREDGSP